MRISTRGRYGLRIMKDLAINAGDTPRMISEICARQKLSPKYVGRLIIPLRQAGMIESKRGIKGGYKIKRKPEDITLLEILEVMEGAISITPCIACPKKCKRSQTCLARDAWIEINKKIRESLASITLRDILDHHYEHGIDCI